MEQTLMFIVGCLMVLMLIFGIHCYQQAYHDSLVCLEKTGMYNGCTFKLEEKTYNVNINRGK